MPNVMVALPNIGGALSSTPLSDLRLKFALSHTMCGSMADIQSGTAEIRRGKKNKQQGKNIMVCPFHRATIIITSGRSNLTAGRIAATHGRFSGIVVRFYGPCCLIQTNERIHHVAPVYWFFDSPNTFVRFYVQNCSGESHKSTWWIKEAVYIRKEGDDS